MQENGTTNGHQPQHARIAATLMSRIASGAYPVGGLLPTEHQLSEEFQRSRQTIREALRHLTQLKLVERQPGVGTRVVQQAPKAHFAYSINSLSELAEYAHEAKLRISGIRKIVVTGEQAALLECTDGSGWHHIQGVRHRRSDGVPLGVTEIYLRDWYPGVQEHLLQLDGATHVMLAREYGVEIDEIRQDARATLLTQAEAGLLSASEGGPGMEVVRRYYLADGSLILSGRIVYPAERFSLSMRFRKSAPG
ncbi:GntR family transcriptional regulator [Ramlibacter albus]|uniref:GntR family transcriptional regulator n=1 Tax=Ramlibacter albus TaxID=2079448 RepID=A0A923S3C5_9BURK|nr:GntR family transcriptional regulator [Ramlibacter albus]MBC5765698.1 GntR family transcriptional regulator [Ramlibacter albus]